MTPADEFDTEVDIGDEEDLPLEDILEEDDTDDDFDEGDFDTEKPKRSLKPLIFIVIISLLGGGGYYYYEMAGGKTLLTKITNEFLKEERVVLKQTNKEDFVHKRKEEPLIKHPPIKQVVRSDMPPPSLDLFEIKKGAFSNQNAVVQNKTLSKPIEEIKEIEVKEVVPFKADIQDRDALPVQKVALKEDVQKISEEVIEKTAEKTFVKLFEQKEKNTDKRFDKLERTIKKIQRESVTKADIESLASVLRTLKKELQSQKKRDEDRRQKERQQVKKKQIKKKSVKTRLNKKTRLKERSKPQWVLRAAKPGIAWVSDGKSREMRTVSKGDSLPGLGRIESIKKDISTGRWVVKGSSNAIYQ